MAPSVLVTGASGFLGSSVVPALRKAGCEVVIASRNLSSRENSELSEVQLNLLDPDSVVRLAEKERFDHVVHLAAMVGWGASDPESLFRCNALATALLADLAKEWCSHLVYASAALVCGSRKPLISPNSLPNPDTDYLLSKFRGEEFIRIVEARACVLRLGGIFGPGGPSHLGINRSLNAALRGEAPLPVGCAKSWRNYIYVEDAANAVVFAIQNKCQGTFNVAGSTADTIGDMVQAMVSRFVPGGLVDTAEGSRCYDQIVVPSGEFPRSRTFETALHDIALSREAGSLGA